MSVAFDEDAMVASLELVQRSGAKSCEFGYLDDNVPVAEARWWAHAEYQGARIQVEMQRGPVEAVEALARRLLTGALCRRCGQPISLNDGAGCRWTRNGKTWTSGCGKPIDQSISKVPR